jgi:glutathione peroxidase
MKLLLPLMMSMAMAMSMALAAPALTSRPAAANASILELMSYRPLAGEGQVNLQKTYGGRVLLIVNTASKCGNTPQYEGLEALHAKYKDRGFAVLGFPSNDFLGQEPGDEKKIKEFCTLTYGVKFPMFEKVHVKGNDATPLYISLKSATGDEPDWNFHKFLIDRNGKVVASYKARTKPDDPKLVADIQRMLAEPAPAAAVQPKQP